MLPASLPPSRCCQRGPVFPGVLRGRGVGGSVSWSEVTAYSQRCGISENHRGWQNHPSMWVACTALCVLPLTALYCVYVLDYVCVCRLAITTALYFFFYENPFGFLPLFVANELCVCMCVCRLAITTVSRPVAHHANCGPENGHWVCAMYAEINRSLTLFLYNRPSGLSREEFLVSSLRCGRVIQEPGEVSTVASSVYCCDTMQPTRPPYTYCSTAGDGPGFRLVLTFSLCTIQTQGKRVRGSTSF